MIRTEFFTGPAIAAHLPALAALRRTVFRAWPYLFDGAEPSQDDGAEPSQADTLSGFASSGTAGLAVAFAADRAVGAATCVHLPEEDAHVTQPFCDAGIDPARVCYFGESGLLEAFRGAGVGVAFFALREAHARTIPGVDLAAFCAVERGEDHPLRPAGHVPLDRFWRRRGYAPTGLVCTMRWKEVGGDAGLPHRLRFWTRSLDAPATGPVPA